MLVALLAFAMERENPAPILWMPLQQLAYRQMMYAVLIKSIGTALAGVRLQWQKLKRVGEFGALSTPPLEPPAAVPDLPPQPMTPAFAPAPAGAWSASSAGSGFRAGPAPAGRQSARRPPAMPSQRPAPQAPNHIRPVGRPDASPPRPTRQPRQGIARCSQ